MHGAIVMKTKEKMKCIFCGIEFELTSPKQRLCSELCKSHRRRKGYVSKGMEEVDYMTEEKK